LTVWHFDTPQSKVFFLCAVNFIVSMFWCQ